MNTARTSEGQGVHKGGERHWVRVRSDSGARSDQTKQRLVGHALGSVADRVATIGAHLDGDLEKPGVDGSEGDGALCHVQLSGGVEKLA